MQQQIIFFGVLGSASKMVKCNSKDFFIGSIQELHLLIEMNRLLSLHLGSVFRLERNPCLLAKGNHQSPTNIDRVQSTVKPVHNDHPLDPKNRSMLERWSIFIGIKLVIFLVGQGSGWSLFRGGR